MWKNLITILCASGTVLAQNQLRTFSKPGKIIRRYTCPDGFVRIRQNCFYFSAGTANWQEAHFFCKDRNATLATLPKKNMNKLLRAHLSGPQMQPWERWIGARYNWEKMVWEWGTTAEQVSYNGFSKLRSSIDQTQQWRCAAMNPARQFRWAARDCIENKHYVCHTLAAKLGKGRRRGVNGPRRRRIKTLTSINGTLTRAMTERNEIPPYSQRLTRKSRPMWSNGMKLGMRPPMKRTRWAPGAKYSDRLQLVKGNGRNEPDQWMSRSKVANISDNHLDPEPSEESSETRVGIARTGPRSLFAGTKNMLDQLNGQLSNMFNEEVMIKN